MAWEVSDPFAETTLEGATEITPSLGKGLEWTVLQSETTRLANLAKRRGSPKDSR